MNRGKFPTEADRKNEVGRRTGNLKSRNECQLKVNEDEVITNRPNYDALN